MFQEPQGGPSPMEAWVEYLHSKNVNLKGEILTAEEHVSDSEN